jgi:hypothetical protein
MPLAGGATATATATTMNTLTTTSTTPSTLTTTEIDSQSHNISTETEPSAHRGGEDTATSLTQPSLPTPAQSPTSTDTGSDSSTTSPLSLTLTPRALKQATVLQLHLSQLRVTDKRSLAHLPAAEQRALLLVHHKQTENARRSEQKYRGNLAGAGNKTGCLGKIRLVRTPPHFGNVGSLSR